MFSIVIPLYNKEKYISHTLESVLAQTFKEYEVIIVNDGSTDNSLDIVRGIDDIRIRTVTQNNAGVSVARNRGIEESKYDLIAFLDADDLWKEDFLETIVILKERYPDCSVFSTNYKVLSSDNTIGTPNINGLGIDFNNGILENYFKIASQSDPILWTSAITVGKEALDAIGGFPEGIMAGEDLLTWARLASKFDIAYTTEWKALFCRWDIPEHTIPRTPDSHDKVGEGLRALLNGGDKDKIAGLEKYIAYWHKIRIAIFLRLDNQIEAKIEFKKMSEFAQKDLKYYIYGVLVYSPQFIKNPLIKMSFFINNILRSKYNENK